MGRKLRVDTHPKRSAIIKAIIKGEPYRRIARTYGLSENAVGRYLREKLATKMAKAKEVQNDLDGSMVLAEIEKIMVRMRMLYDACHEYLLDPDDKTRYELGPRAWEIVVTYLDGDIKTPKKRNLQLLLDDMNKNGDEPERRKLWLEVKYKHADPRKLIIETAATMTKHLELMARICGELKDSPLLLNQVLVYLPVLETEKEWLKLNSKK